MKREDQIETVQTTITKPVYVCEVCEKKFGTSWQCSSHEENHLVDGIEVAECGAVYLKSEEDARRYAKRYWSGGNCIAGRFVEPGWYYFESQCNHDDLDDYTLRTAKEQIERWGRDIASTQKAIDAAKELK